MNPNVRKWNETQLQFRARRANEKFAEKMRRRGRMLWPAIRGTYVRARDGIL